MVADCKRNNFLVPKIEEKFNGIEVVFHKNEPLNEPLNERQKNILLEIKNKSKITIEELKNKYKVGRETIKRDILYLQKHNIIKKQVVKKWILGDCKKNDKKSN